MISEAIWLRAAALRQCRLRVLEIAAMQRKVGPRFLTTVGIRMKWPTAYSLAAAALLTLVEAGTASAQPPLVTGLWQQVDPSTGKSEGWFLFRERDGVFEGVIAKMFIPPGENPHPRCTQCEGDLRNAPLLGLRIISGMRRHGLEYEDGTILDPRDGSRYNALMRLSPDGKTLTVRGYLGVSLFGQDQTWTRLPDSAFAEIDPSLTGRRQPHTARTGTNRQTGSGL
jgi:Uncharacterized protein conserved in bacteria (DUF2147)